MPATNGKDGNDQLYGGYTRDTMLGGSGDDIGYGNGGDDLIVAKVDPHHAPAIDQKLELVVELESLHLFDAATERRLTA